MSEAAAADPEFDSLRREAEGDERAEADQEQAERERVIESAERRLKKALAKLGHDRVPAPFGLDGEEQDELAEAWAPILEDFDMTPAADAPSWWKWGYALVATGMIAGPRAYIAYRMMQERNVAESEGEEAGAGETGSGFADQPRPGEEAEGNGED